MVVVGASMGGMRAAEAARKAGYQGPITVIGDEPHMPYNRPPLSKEALAGRPDPAALIFRVPRAAQDVNWRLGTTVTAADLTARTVTLDTGEVLPWEGLVVATGLRPRRLPLPGPAAGRYVIRTLADAQELHEQLEPGRRLVVIGAGFIGCELAATARKLGVSVDVVAPEPVPMQRPLGDLLGQALQQRHEAAGVRFHLGVLPVAFGGSAEDPDAVGSVSLSDGTVLPADLVVEAVGCATNVEWLEGNGLDLSDGVRCDNHLRVEGRPEVVACGDVAKFPNLLFDDIPRRVEHWTMVTDTAKRAGSTLGRHLAGNGEAEDVFAPVPSFWSDQYDIRIQSFGAVGLGTEDIRVLEGSPDTDVVVGYHRDGELVGVVMVGFGGKHAQYRTLISTVGQGAVPVRPTAPEPV
ncbi:NAD(P)/FAD-dependent oxidoreductase [Nakamurella silvestris]|nr:NAD(P)/FAD-dependent oxidoreductase [Nakamurella silvestris]